MKIEIREEGKRRFVFRFPNVLIATRLTARILCSASRKKERIPGAGGSLTEEDPLPETDPRQKEQIAAAAEALPKERGDPEVVAEEKSASRRKKTQFSFRFGASLAPKELQKLLRSAVKTLKAYKKQHPDWVLLDVKDSDGDGVKIKF